MTSQRVTGRAPCTTRCVTNLSPILYPVMYYPFRVCLLRRALCATPLLRSPPLPRPPSVRARCTVVCETSPVSLVPPPPCSSFPVFSRLLCALPLSPYPFPLPTFLPSLAARHYADTLHTVPSGAGCLVAARCGVPPCPKPPRAAGGQLGCGAPFCSFLYLYIYKHENQRPCT